MYQNRKSFAQIADEALVKIRANNKSQQNETYKADVISLCTYRNTKKKEKSNAQKSR